MQLRLFKPLVHQLCTVVLDHWSLQLWLAVKVDAKVNVQEVVFIGRWLL